MMHLLGEVLEDAWKEVRKDDPAFLSQKVLCLCSKWWWRVFGGVQDDNGSAVQS